MCINVAGIMGDAKAGPEGLVVDKEWGPLANMSGEVVKSLCRKKMNFFVWNGEFWVVF